MPFPGLLLMALLAQAPAGDAPPPDLLPAGRYVAGAGVLYRWDGAAPVLTPSAPQGGLPPGSTLHQAVPFAAGRRLLALTTVTDAGGKKHARQEGRALVLDTSQETPRLLAEIPLEGSPFDAVVTLDGSRAYVLARRVAAAGGSPDGQHWVHEIDLETGKLAGNTLLASAASGIAVDPSGRRVFVALHDRIQSCSTHPITTSWIYRSPGPNGQLAVRPDTGTLCVGRGDEVALFDPAAIAARSAAERHDRLDDATGVVPLPLTVSGLSLSGDGRLAVVQGANRLAFLDCASLALTWASDLPAEVTTAEEIRPLAFPAAGGDLLVAIFPGARVAAIRSPAPVHLPPGHGAQPPVTLEPSQTQAAGPESAGPEAAGPEAVGSAAVAAKPAASPAAGSDAAPEHGPATAATTAPTPPPHAEGPAPHENPPSPVSPPDGPAAAPATAEFLSGEMSGDFKRVQAIVLYGPNNITREFVRVRPAPDGTWRTPLPPPGVYRIVPAGDSAAPLPAAPGFLSVKVEPGKGQNGIDFTILFSR